VGLKIDVDAMPSNLVAALLRGTVNLADPATTVALLKLNAIVGVTGIFAGDTLQSIGIQCAFCHSTVDNSAPALCFGAITPNPGTGCIGHRLDGWSNRDLNVGAIVALAPNLQPFADLLNTTPATVRTVLNSWGPGKFDAELVLDGKAFNPMQLTDGVVTGTNVSGRISSSINWRCRHPNRQRGASIRLLPTEAMSCSAAKPNATTVMSSRSGAIPAGICIRRQKSASIAFRPTGPLTAAIAPHRLGCCLRMSKVASITTDDFRRSPRWWTTTTRA
jgi:hypothetical protein